MYTESGKNGAMPLLTEVAEMSAPQRNGISLQSSTSLSGIYVPYNSGCDVGMEDFTIVWRGSMYDWVGVAAWLILDRTGSAGAYTGWGFYLGSNGAIALYLYNGDAGTAYSLGTINYADNTVHELAITVTRESENAAGTITAYADGYQIGSASITAAVVFTLSTASTFYILGSSTTRNRGTAHRVLIFNIALTATEIYNLFCGGVPYEYSEGSNTACYSSDWSASSDFSGTRCTVAANIDGVLGVDDTLRAYASADASANHYLARPGTLTVGTYYRGTFDYYIPSANTHVTGVRVGNSAVEYAHTTQGSWVTGAEIPVFQYSNGSLIVWMQSGSSTSFTGAGSVTDDLVYLKNLVLYPVGVCLFLDSDGIQAEPGQWLDCSINKNHAQHPTSYSKTLVKKRDFEIRWINSWSGTHEAQYIGGINKNILPENAYITQIIGVVSGSTVQDIVIGDGSDVDRFVAITTGLAVGTVLFAIASPTSDGTNRKLVVDPDTNATMTIAFTIRGVILEA